MPVIKKSMTTPYSVEKMFDIVEDVQQYPQFLPWCTHTQTLYQKQVSKYDLQVNHLEEFESNISCSYMRVVRIDILYQGLQTQFTTQNICIPSHRITMNHHATKKQTLDPLRKLQGYWQFEALEASTSQVSFYVEYEFKNIILKKIFNKFFNHMMGKFVQSFFIRAQHLYGP